MFNKLAVLPFLLACTAHSMADVSFTATNQSLQSGMINELSAQSDTGSGLLAVGNNSALPASPTYRNGILSFDIGAIPDNIVFTGANLTLRHQTSFGSAPLIPTGYDVYLVGFSNAAAAYPAGAIFKSDDIDQPSGDGIRIADNAFGFLSTVGTSVSITSSSLIDALNTRPNGNGGDYVFFRINGDATPPADFRSAVIISNLPTSPGNFPTFSMTYAPAPEPSSAILIGIGAVALSSRRSQRRKA